MRQNNNNKRMRGRSSSNNSNPNRRSPNPLTRSFESNGPDAKVRGTAQHIAEKYTQLARDAHTSGDRVAAESYLQHAEHYFRIISAAHLAQQARDNGTEEREESEDEEFDTVLDRFTFRPPQSAPPQNGVGNQPYQSDRPNGEYPSENGLIEGDDGQGEQPRDRNPQPIRVNERLPQPDRQQDRYNPQDRRNGERRNEPNPNPRFDRNRERDRGRNPNNAANNERAERSFRPRNDGDVAAERYSAERPNVDRVSVDRSYEERPQPERSNFRPRLPRLAEPADMGEQPILPAFLTAPVRAIPIEVATPAPEAFAEGEGGEGRSQFRVRRRRKPVALEAADAGTLPLDPTGGESV